MAPVRGYVGPTIIRTNPNPGLSCMKPEIASVDDRSNFAAFDYTFSVVWHEGVPSGVIPPTQWNVWYNDGTTVTSPAPGTVLTPGSLGIINVPGNQVDAIEPDIAATQDNQTNETYFFHITYEFKMWTPLSPQLNSIESHFSCGPSRTPGAASFIITPTVRGPTPIQLENPTIASKLISLGPTVFESWVAWEDYSNVIPANVPDIWFRMGTYTVGTPNVVWAVPPGIVGYALANVVGTEYNPEFWNRNDATRMFPTLTHLVFEDWTPAGAVANIIYIDP